MIVIGSLRQGDPEFQPSFIFIPQVSYLEILILVYKNISIGSLQYGHMGVTQEFLRPGEKKPRYGVQILTFYEMT